MKKLPIEQHGDDLMLTFDEELLEELGWNVGDNLDWEIQPDGSITLTKYETTND